MNCPGCGAPIAFRTERAFYAVCSACGQMLVKRELGLELLGMVAECQPDGTLLQVGTRGQDQARGFTVSGRTQLRYGDGFWNEWYLVYDDGATGWLGEAMGQYFISSPLTHHKVLSDLADPPKLGDVIKLDKERFTTLDLKRVEIASFEGELPSLGEVEKPYLSADLRDSKGNGLTVDYQARTPAIYRGRWTDFNELVLTNLKHEVPLDVPVASSEVRSVTCIGCGAPFELVTGAVSRTYVCQYCGAAMDSSHPELVELGAAVDRAQELAQSATLKLGTEVHLPEGVFQLIGFCESSTTVEGQKYFWKEYLLYHRSQGYRWLSQTEYHFTLFQQLRGVPTTLGDKPQGRLSREGLRHEGRRYKHFQTSTVVTERVVGEFYWRLSRGERSRSWDFISPPYLLSASVADSDITWSLGRYLSHQELRQTIPGVTGLRASWSPGANQPNPYQANRFLRQFAVASIAAVVMVKSGVLLSGDRVLWEADSVPFRAPGIVTEQRISQAAGSLRLDVTVPDLKRRFVDLNATFDSTSRGGPRSGKVRLANADGEKSVQGTVLLNGVPSGAGLLRLEARSGPPDGKLPSLRETADIQDVAPSKDQFHFNFKVTQLAPGPGSGSMYFALLLLFAPLMAASSLANGFEKRRWAESDYG